MESDHKNYYEVLEVPVSSSQEEIYEGYVRSKNAYSGDSIALYSLMTEEECRGMIEMIEEAYSVLSDPKKRRDYDRARGFAREEHTGSNGHFADHMERGTAASLLEETQSLANEEGANYRNAHSNDSNSFTINRNETEISKISALKKFSLDYVKDPEFEQAIENATEYTGEFLKKIREYKNVSLERMAEMTRVSRTYIRHIEDDDFEKLPALAYVRGFVYQYAKCLKLGPEIVASSYIHHLKLLMNNKSA